MCNREGGVNISFNGKTCNVAMAISKEKVLCMYCSHYLALVVSQLIAFKNEITSHP